MRAETAPLGAEAKKASERVGPLSQLRGANLFAGGAHLAQGVLMVVLSSAFSLPITASFLKLDPATQTLVPEPRTIVDVRVAWLVAAFLFMSAAAHLILWSSRRTYAWYQGNIQAGVNPARWIEYSLSSSVMIVIIAMLVGIYDIASLVALFGVNAGMIFFGHMMERHNRTTKRTDWTAFWLGSALGAVPWIAIGIYLFGTPGVPTFVYWIYASIFVFFNVFALNMVSRYRGNKRSAVAIESRYIFFSLAAKSLLAWQVFAGTLRPM